MIQSTLFERMEQPNLLHIVGMVLICLNLLDSSSQLVRPSICKSHLSAERLISAYRRFLEEVLFVPFEIVGVVSPSVRSLIVFDEHFKENVHRYVFE